MTTSTTKPTMPWNLTLTVIGVLITVVSLGLTLYPPRADVSFQVASETNVLDIHKPLRDLAILFRGKDIQHEQLNLRIVTLRVENTGRVDILEGYYDHSQPWGFTVENGDIIESRVTGGNDRYLVERARMAKLASGMVEFPKCILECGKYFTLEILIVHKKDAEPQIVPVGKIAGVQSVRVVSLSTEHSAGSVVSRAFGGGFWVNLLRLAAALLVVVILIWMLLWLGYVREKIKRTWRRRQRKRNVEEMGKDGILRANRAHRFFANLYTLHGLDALETLAAFLNRPVPPDLVHGAISSDTVSSPAEDGILIEIGCIRIPLPLFNSYNIRVSEVRDLIKNQILVDSDEDTVVADPQLRDELGVIIAAVKDRYPDDDEDGIVFG